jgi:hypothetical protein
MVRKNENFWEATSRRVIGRSSARKREKLVRVTLSERWLIKQSPKVRERGRKCKLSSEDREPVR